jgi:xanthine dehydrogenase accessory factor
MSFYSQLTTLESTGVPFVLVILVDALGSTPQDAGAKMLVTKEGLHAGTVGGGRIEAKTIGHAQTILHEMERGTLPRPSWVNWTLKTDVGMTCGGSVKLYFEPHAGAGGGWPIVIFGAGHIAQALVPVLAPLSCSISVYDTRPEWLAQLPGLPNVHRQHVTDLAAVIDALPANAFVLCVTQGHSTDRPILFRALSTRDFPYLGCIGSDAKAAVLRKELIAAGLTSERVAQFHCPAGLDFGTNHPHEIALSIAAQLLSVRDEKK